MSEDAEAAADGVLRHGGYECSRWISIARVLPLESPVHCGSMMIGFLSPHVEHTYLIMSSTTPQFEQFVGSGGGPSGGSGRRNDRTSAGMSGWM